MITESSKEDVIAIGVRFRANYLLEQYGYTAGLAKLDGQDLVDLMPENLLDDVDAAAGAVTAAYQEKLVASEESKDSTRAQNEAVHQAKLWRRAVVSRCASAKRGGKHIPALLLRIEKCQSLPEITSQVDGMVKLLETNSAALHGAGLDKRIEEGRAIAKALKALDAEQELKRTKHFSDKMQAFYHQKGLLYLGLKRINDAGHELHRGDATATNKYSLAVLYRHTGKQKPKDGPPSAKG